MKNPSLMRLKLSQLEVHPTAQRDLIPARVKKIANNFNPCLLGVLIVSTFKLPTGLIKYLIVDGQHRYSALISKFDGDFLVDVKVYTELTAQEEHSLFLGHNDRALVNAFARHVNSVKSGDLEAKLIDSALAEHQWHVGQAKGLSTVAAIRGLYDLVKNADIQNLKDTVRFMKLAYPNDILRVDGYLLQGCGKFLFRNRDTVGFSIEQAAIKIGKTPLLAVQQSGSNDAAAKRGIGGRKLIDGMAWAFTYAYNFGRKKNLAK